LGGKMVNIQKRIEEARNKGEVKAVITAQGYTERLNAIDELHELGYEFDTAEVIKPNSIEKAFNITVYVPPFV